MKKIIGLDIDGTMYDMDAVDRISDLLGLNIKSEEIVHWNFDRPENNLPDYFINLLYSSFESVEYMCNLKLNPFVKDTVMEWKHIGHELHIISARRSSVRLETVEMLNRDFGKGFFDSINFVQYKTDEKQEIINKRKLDIWVDDNPRDLGWTCEKGIDTYAICNEKTKYNHKKVHQCINLYDNCYKVKNFGEIKL